MHAEYATIEELQEWAARWRRVHPHDFLIGDPDKPYMLRWFVVPRNAFANVYLHHILRSDDDRALHDHPWANTSLLIEGSYIEHTPKGQILRKAGDVVKRPADALHRLELIDDKPAVSLFMTGPKTREWGFECPQGWVHWQDFTGGDRGGQLGKGCGE